MFIKIITDTKNKKNYNKILKLYIKEKILKKRLRWCSSDSKTFFSSVVKDVLETKLKELPNDFGLKILKNLQVKWGFIPKILNRRFNKNKKNLQNLIEAEVIKLNEEYFRNSSKATNLPENNPTPDINKSWKVNKDKEVLFNFINKISKTYNPNKILNAALTEMFPVWFIEKDGNTLPRLKQTTFILALYANFYKIYESLECRREDYNQIKINLNEKEQFMVGEFLLAKLLELQIVEQIKEKNKNNYFKGEFFITPKNFLDVTSSTMYRNIENLPLVYCPKEWQNKKLESLAHLENTDDQFVAVDGGLFKTHSQNNYLYRAFKEETNNPKVIYGSDTMFIKYETTKALTAINHIQNTAFEIDVVSLTKVLENLKIFLEREENITVQNFKTLLDFIKSQPKSPTLSETQHFTIYKEAYNLEILKFIKIINTLFFALLFKDTSLYFVVFSDFRGRAYRKGYPLNPMSGFLCKILLKIQSTKEKTVHLDARASAFSIMGMLTGQPKLLELTKIIKTPKKEKTLEPEDFYLYTLKLLEKEIPILKSLLKYTGEQIITRDYLKKILIPFSYNQTIFETYKTIKTFDTLAPLEVALQTSNIYGGLKNPLYYFALEIRTTIENFFKELVDIKNVLNVIVSSNTQNKSIQLLEEKTNGLINSRMFYAEFTTEQIKLIHLKNQKTAYIKKPIEPRTLDLSKCRIAAFPNFLHGCDALLLLFTVLELKKNNIPVSTNHDCFMVLESHIEATQAAYIKAVKTLMAQDLLLAALDSQHVMPTETKRTFKLLKKMKTDRNKILNKETFHDCPLKEEQYQFLPEKYIKN